MTSSLESIVLVAGYRQATVLTHEGASKVPLGDALDLDAFAEALMAQMSTPVSVVEGLRLPDDLRGTAVVGDYTFVRWLQEEADPEGLVTPRVVWLNANRTTALPELERGRLAAAVDVGTYSAWRVRREGAGQASIYGLKALAEQLDASCFEESDRYCLMSARRLPSLPALLVAYLALYLPLIDEPPAPRRPARRR